jgi:hypothetical protein
MEMMTMKKMTKQNGWIKVPLKSKVYSLPAIYSAGYVFMDKAYTYLEPEGKDGVAVWLTPKKKGADLDVLAKDFIQELMSYSNYFSRLTANADGMKLLMQRALFAAPPAAAKEAEEKEIQDLIRELEAEEQKENKKVKK